jgi:hypothetical protein
MDTSQDPPRLAVGDLISDFDVRFGVNAGAERNRTGDFLYAAITHGIATGSAATILASRLPASDEARRLVMTAFLRQLDAAQLASAADALKLTGLGPPNDKTLLSRLTKEVNSSSLANLGAMEQAFKANFPSFTPWAP